ncbi:hypothetical protein SETIT_6G019800v2 [Setaria italica]|uniref:Uncharacterized protein n=1 Tax=Setaria italica TaxID=4555 RepID=K3YH79_SETIT|nr:F-box/FBD/LRR-repeat protein At1g16930 isoform X2 [Setaria italica]RCV29515.1 hypothetical protein SETIT_6G019800v2 [Setaria italica]RCV29516.1 hypothetical protein SETIT_6G019800v2 [Setaria italica]
MASCAPFPNLDRTSAADLRDTEHLLSYICSCVPDPPVSTTARLVARRGAAASKDGVDRISGLSDALLRDIVSRLPFKDAARTSVLATRWRRVWLAAPLAVADAHLLDHWPPAPADAPAVTAAVSGALAAHPGPFRCAHLVSTRMDAYQPQLKRWLRILAAKGVQELVLVNRPGPREVPLPDTLFRIANLTCLYIGFWKFPHASHLQGASFPNLRELGICSVVVKDGDIDSLVARSPLLEILNIQGSMKGLCLVGQSLRCVQICASMVESITLVSTPCLERLILWEVRASPNPASGLRTRIKIGTAPKLCVLGYLDPTQHLLEIGGTSIMPGIAPSASTILTSVKCLSLKVCFGANDAMKVPAFLKCFPNVEALHIMSAKCDEPADKLNLKFWQEVGPIRSVVLCVKVMTICEFRGGQHELAFLQFIYQNARVLNFSAIVSANVRVTGISANQIFSIVQNMDSSRWARNFNLAILGSKGPEGGRPWKFQRGANFSNDDPFAPVKS